MPTIFIGIFALALMLWLLKSFASADPRALIIGGCDDLSAIARERGEGQLGGVSA